MPRHPQIALGVAASAPSPFSRLARRALESGRRIHALHIGDTYAEAPLGCRMEDLRTHEIEGLHRYSPVEGQAMLTAAVAERLSRRQEVPTTEAEILVTAGATGGLGAVLGAVTEPGDEVLVLAPFWPLILGVIRGHHAVPVAVDTLAEGLASRLQAAVGPRTVALYVNTPNNPTGAVLSAGALTALVDFARRHDLWLLADECYEDYVYTTQHVALRGLAPERTFSVHSFSKAYGMAGNRCGYVASPPGLTAQLRKISLHTFYATPTASQHAAIRALEGPGDAFVAEMRPRYQAAGNALAAALGAPAPAAGTFLFVDLGPALGDTPLLVFLERCADAGLLLAPGTSFGAYPTHVRICFTAAPPDQMAEATEALLELLGGAHPPGEKVP